MQSFLFYNPTKLYFGKNQIEHLVPELQNFGMTVLLVYGGGSVKRTGLYDEIKSCLIRAHMRIFELSGIEPNPKLETIQEGIDLCKKEKIDVVLAVGGGSCIDAAKLICVAAKFDGDPWQIVMQKVEPKEALPLGVILTIAATGSEMNGTSVISRRNTKEKYSWSHILAYPKFSILDPTYTITVPKDQTVYGIVDMMTHIMEQYFHRTPHTPILDRMCEGLLQTIIETTPKVVKNLEDYQARETLMYAGTLALNRSLSTGADGDWAAHGIEHALSAYYDIPHGGGLAIIYPQWMKHVASFHPKRFSQFATRVFQIDSNHKTTEEVIHAGIEALQHFWCLLGAPSRLSDYKIDDTSIEKLVAHAMKRPLGKIKLLTAKDIRQILLSSL